MACASMPGSQKTTILNHLDLRCKFDEFLGALEAAGQASDAKALILIDALNESEGRNIWQNSLPELLNTISRYPWVGLGISVRTSYESSTIPEGLVPETLSTAEHRGFEYDLEGALKIFFDENNIERPGVPLLDHEFSNPQFLILLCKGLKNRGWNRIPDGLSGITAVYNFFLDSVNRKLSTCSDLGYSEHEPIVFRAVDCIVECMIEKNRTVLKYDEVVIRLQDDAYLPNPRSLLRHLIWEGVLQDELNHSPSSDRDRVIMFTYERLADNLVVQEQLKNIEREREISTQCISGVFARYLASPQRYRGIIDALSIQIPERLQKELVEVCPEITRSEIGWRSFLESLMWRNPSSIGESAGLLIAKCLESGVETSTVFRVLLTISTNPKHSHNAEYLHELLLKLEMGERDAVWSTFLHQNYSQQDPSIVRQYIDWAYTSDHSTLLQESAYLASLALAWFLVSPNRSVRDRSTKALVSLWTRQMDVAVRVLRKFDSCNDPYVVERLFGAAYGCAMKNSDIEQLKKLAEYTYSVIFKDGRPPPNILLRDYARGIIEYALHKEIDLRIESNKLRPPYNSDWIKALPSESDIKELQSAFSETESKGALQIFSSLSWSGDFFRYIIGANSDSFQWSCIPLLPNKIPRMQLLEKFCSKLNNEQWSYWENYVSEFSKKDELRKKLTRNQRNLFDRHISPSIELLRGQDHRSIAPDLNALARWIVKKVFDLGWSLERFEKHDYNITLDWKRLHRPAERMGKKYQWIAYYELLARVSDNFEFIGEDRSDILEIYEGVWQLWDLRNIDPSLVLAEPARYTVHNNSVHWADQSIYDAWDFPIDDVEWLKNTEDLPDFKSIIEINQKDGSTWLALGGSITLTQSVPADQEPYERPRRNVFFLLESCLTRKTNTNKLYNWSKGLDPYRRQFPEAPSIHNTFLGELYWDRSIQQLAHFDPSWIKPQDLPSHIPVRSLVSTYKYTSQTSEYDHSSDVEATWRLPNNFIIDKMNLINKGDGTFVNVKGDIIAYDPSMKSSSASVLLVRKEEFVQFLLDSSYGIVWRIIGEKSTPGGVMAFGGEWKGKLEMSGSYKTTNGKIMGVYKTRFIEPPK